MATSHNAIYSATGDYQPLVLDIETVPLAASLAAPYPEAERTPPSNYKSEDAIAKWREADRAAWAAARVKECSLNPRLGRIVSVGVQQGRALECLVARTAEEEAGLLQDLWGWIGSARGRCVTWNGSWDLRFILIRSLAHGITPTVPPSTTREWFRRYSTFPHFDCKAVLTNWDAPKAGEGLTEWATFLGLDGKDGHTGADVFGLVQAGQWDTLEQYNMADVRATAAVFNRIAPYFG